VKGEELGVEEWEIDVSGVPGQAVRVSEWVYDAVEFICSEVTVALMDDVYVPAMKVQSNYGDWIYVPVFGQVAVELSRERYCWNCFEELASASEVNLCERCRGQQKELGLAYQWWRCGGLALDCAEFLARNADLVGFTLYLGLYGRLICIGVSYQEVEELQMIERGFDVAVTFSGSKGLLKLSEACKYCHVLRRAYAFEPEDFILKVQNLGRVREEDIRKLHELKREIEARCELQVKAVYNLADLYFEVPAYPKIYPRGEDWVVGKVLGAKGELVFLQGKMGVSVFNMRDLLGRKLVNVKG